MSNKPKTYAQLAWKRRTKNEFVGKDTGEYRATLFGVPSDFGGYKSAQEWSDMLTFDRQMECCQSARLKYQIDDAIWNAYFWCEDIDAVSFTMKKLHEFPAYARDFRKFVIDKETRLEMVRSNERIMSIEDAGIVTFEVIHDSIETLQPIGHADDDVETLTESEAIELLATFNIFIGVKPITLRKVGDKQFVIESLGSENVTYEQGERTARIAIRKADGTWTTLCAGVRRGAWTNARKEIERNGLESIRNLMSEGMEKKHVKITFGKRLRGEDTVYAVSIGSSPICADTLDVWTAEEVFQQAIQQRKSQNLSHIVEYWDGIQGEITTRERMFQGCKVTA